MPAPRISIIAALGKNRAIGKDTQLLWHIPADLKRFKALTTGHPVIMGRKTFESILTALGGPLPGRTNVVITRDEQLALRLAEMPIDLSNVSIVHSLDEALKQARALDSEEIFIGGGAQLYEQALPLVDRLYLTLIDDEQEGDAYFPPYEHLFTKKRSEQTHEWNGLQYSWIDLEK